MLEVFDILVVEWTNSQTLTRLRPRPRFQSLRPIKVWTFEAKAIGFARPNPVPRPLCVRSEQKLRYAIRLTA